MKYIKRKVLVSTAVLISLFSLDAAVTIGQCVDKAMDHYPVVRKYDLLSSTCDIELSDINKGWLPRISLYGQATVQNAVPSFPETLSGVLENMGQKMEGLDKVQYKAGIDVSQTIWDGGVSRARRDMERLRTEAGRSALDVELYEVRQRVENLYFAILLTEERIEQNKNMLALIDNNLDRLRSMLKNGTAMQCDVDMLEAHALEIDQNIDQAKSAAGGYRRVLEIFIGESLQGQDLVRPEACMPPAGSVSGRPELKLFENRIAVTGATRRLSHTSVMPKIGLFAQAYYGYPGYDYFRNMINRDLSFNISAGVKVSWTIDSFYTKRNAGRRADAETGNILADKETFLFNSAVQTASVSENINGLRDVIAKDARIISLRKSVRQAAESQLENGVTDVTALLTKITDENQAMLTARFHEIRLLQEIYNLKYILNR